MPEGGTLVLLIITLRIHHLLHHRPTEDLNCFNQYFMVIYHIFCSNMFVFACPIGYLHSRSIFAPEFNFRYLRSGVKDYMSKSKERCGAWYGSFWMIPGLILKMSCFYKYLLIYSPPSTNSGWYTQNGIPTCVLVRVKLGSVPFNSCKCPSDLRYTVFSTTAISSICSHSRLVGPCFYMLIFNSKKK